MWYSWSYKLAYVIQNQANAIMFFRKISSRYMNLANVIGYDIQYWAYDIAKKSKVQCHILKWPMGYAECNKKWMLYKQNWMGYGQIQMA